MADIDQRLAAILNAGAPPEPDPFFRIKLLERRERERFRRRSFFFAIAVLASAGIIAVSVGAGAGIAETASIVLLCTSLAAAIAYVPVLVKALQQRLYGGSSR